MHACAEEEQGDLNATQSSCQASRSPCPECPEVRIQPRCSTGSLQCKQLVKRMWLKGHALHAPQHKLHVLLVIKYSCKRQSDERLIIRILRVATVVPLWQCCCQQLERRQMGNIYRHHVITMIIMQQRSQKTMLLRRLHACGR
jgi:hypothetical protein